MQRGSRMLAPSGRLLGPIAGGQGCLGPLRGCCTPELGPAGPGARGLGLRTPFQGEAPAHGRNVVSVRPGARASPR